MVSVPSAIECRSCIGACESERPIPIVPTGTGDARLDAGADESAIDEASSKDDAMFVADWDGVISDAAGTTPKPPEPPRRRAMFPPWCLASLASAWTGGGGDEGEEGLGVQGQASAVKQSRIRLSLVESIDRPRGNLGPVPLQSLPLRPRQP